MKKVKIPVPNKFKWNKSALIETDLYIRVYLSALNAFMTTEEKHTLFIISKFFTDGAAESGRGNFAIADYYFQRGEAYHHEIGAEKVFLRRMLYNIYHRSKSFYHYRHGNTDLAIHLIQETQSNSRELEKSGLAFLVFDRVQQYYNLARVYFSKQEGEKAFKMLSGAVCFLVQGKNTFLPDLNEHYLKEYTPDLIRMRHLLTCQILFETLEQVIRLNDKDKVFSAMSIFYPAVLKAADKMVILTPEDTQVKKWILLLADFFEGRNKKFKTNAADYIAREPVFFGGKPASLLNQYLAFA